MGNAQEIRLIAFYLPQYHPIPENDKWWGKGFTEWTNVTKAKPNFEGHYQPHVPADLGYYDLRSPEVKERQAALAREYGIYGFCYHYYWFNGKKLLYLPLEEVLKSKKPDFPFCVNWANENWTRRWDGAEHEILIAQNHSPESDKRFIRDLLPLFRDKRYIRINSKPLLLVYRVGLLPNPRQTVEIWREECIKAGIGEIYLCVVQTTDSTVDPRPFGFDAAVEFPPHGIFLHPINHKYRITNADFSGNIHDYKRVIINYIGRKKEDYKLFKTVVPSWDNTARRRNHGTIFTHSSPEYYEFWLREVIAQTKERYSGDERLVFINAWNEWAEGCYLEPNEKDGRRFLEVTQKTLLKGTEREEEVDILKECSLDNVKKQRDLFRNMFYTCMDMFYTCMDMFYTNVDMLTEKDRQLKTILNSRGWRITAPLRGLYSFLRRMGHSGKTKNFHEHKETKT